MNESLDEWKESDALNTMARISLVTHWARSGSSICESQELDEAIAPGNEPGAIRIFPLSRRSSAASFECDDNSGSSLMSSLIRLRRE
jgi:hypothetical protein